MACRLKEGPVIVSLQQTEEGYRTVKAKYIVNVDKGDSVFTVLTQTPGLPVPGGIWAEGTEADPDIFCTLETDVALFKDREYLWYEVTRTFTNKPGPDVCPIDYSRKDPLHEPAKVSGRFTKFTEEATHDRFYLPILSSAGDMMRGPAVEFDDSRFSIRVEQNVYPLRLPLLYAHKDAVNDRPIWGFPYRSVKVSAIAWNRKFYGPPRVTGSGTGTSTVETCRVFYVRTVELDVFIKRDPLHPQDITKMVSGHDRDVPDEGPKVRKGKWDSNPKSPNFRRWLLEKEVAGNDFDPKKLSQEDLCEYKDTHGNVTRANLNGFGLPAGIDGVTEYAYPVAPFGFVVGFLGPQAKIHVEKYPEADLIGNLKLPLVIEL